MDFITRLQVDPRNTAEVGAMIHVPSIGESREVPHFPHAIWLFFQKISMLTMYRYILYLLFRMKKRKVHNPRQYTKSQLII